MSVRISWERIASWLRREAPDMLDAYLSPATDSTLAALELQLGAPLPDDVRTFWKAAGGVDAEIGALGIFPPDWDEWEDMPFSPMGPVDAGGAWAMLGALLDEGNFEGDTGDSEPGVAADFWNKGWLPFAENGGGDYLCIDLAPANEGVRGQVITHSHETGRHQVLAPSLAVFLSMLAGRLEAGELVYDEDLGVVPVET